MATLTQAQKDAITAENVRTFQRKTPDYFGCPSNSTKMIAWLEDQLGVEYGKQWAYSVENFEAAWAWLSENSIMIQRPEGQDSIAERQREAQEQIDADKKLVAYAEEVQEWVHEETVKLKQKPMSELRVEAAQQRRGLSAAREERGHVTQVGAESRPIVVSSLAEARAKVMAENPGMRTNTDVYNRLVQAELAKV
jgi:hypothetical protein